MKNSIVRSGWPLRIETHEWRAVEPDDQAS